MTKGWVENSTVPPSGRKLSCGHKLIFTLSPPPVGEIVVCPACSRDDPPRQVTEKFKVDTEARLHHV